VSDESFEGALGALAHEARVAILRALADADRPLPFTELRSRAGVADPGRFNYHLNELRDRFVRDAGEGYELNYRGKRLLVVAGDGVRTDDGPPVGDAETCPVCGEADCDRLIHVHLETPARS
jgi:DNA-binding transcriptional ArsR family regulator